VQEPAVPGKRSKSKGAGRFVYGILLLMMLGFGGLVLLAVVSFAGLIGGDDDRLEEKYHSLAKGGSNKVAIISVVGTILDGQFTKRQIDRARRDKQVKAIVLRVNSPGGTITGSDYVYHHLKQLREDRQIPMVVSMGGIAASGGYYVSMAVGDQQDCIFAEPTTWTGSIGVIIPHYDLSGLMQKLQIEEDSVQSHRLKQMGSMMKPMTEEERTIFQELVDESFDRFKQVIKSGRPVFRDDDETLDRVATGQIFTTRQAIENGLVDKEGFIEDAIDRVIEMAGLDAEDTKVVKYQRPLGLLDIAMGVHASSQRSELAALLDLLSPRAYYLFTWPEAAQ
jgi:protease-4